MKRVLVTGASGFVGRWLCAALVHDGWEVTATSNTTPEHLDASAPWGTLEGVHWELGDSRDGAHWERLVSSTRPDAVVHLAAISNVPHATREPALTWEVNVVGSVRLLAALSGARAGGDIDPVVLLIGSAEQYGRASSNGPLNEETRQAPITVYGASKSAQEMAGMQEFRASGLKVIPVRPFPHSGPGQELRFVLPALVARAVQLEHAPAGTPLTLGNTSPIRDFLHVSDVVAGYIALLHRGQPGIAYNVASGVGLSVRDVAEHVLARVGVVAPLEEAAGLTRPVDVPILVGDATRLMSETGWRPHRRFDDILDDLLNHYRRHAATY